MIQSNRYKNHMFESPESFLQNEPAYRLKQVKQALYRDLISDWNEAKTLPQQLRDKLSNNIILKVKTDCIENPDNATVKALLTFSDGAQVESVLMRHADKRNTVCVSSQVGCALQCAFCATGKIGFKRNLSADEIVAQVLYFARSLKAESQRVTNIVFMGMGEPFLNYDAVMKAIRILHDPDGFNLGSRHISVSTSGIIEGIDRFPREGLEVNLAVSLHAPNDTLRTSLMPINQKYPLKEVIAAVGRYIDITKRRVMFEYILIQNINDSPECAQELNKLLHGMLCFVNLISYNPTGNFSPSVPAQRGLFKETLEKLGIDVTERYRFGVDINAACGQLATHSLP